MAMIVALIDRPVHDAAWAPAMWGPGLPGQGHQNAHLGQLLDVAARSSIWNALHVIIWVNGAFGSGKTTLTEQVLRVLPESMNSIPNTSGTSSHAGCLPLTAVTSKIYPCGGAWSVDFALGLRQEYRRPLIVPMTLVDPVVRGEIFDRLNAGGEPVLHVWLDVPAPELRRRVNMQVLIADDPDADQRARDFRLAAIERCTAAADDLPPDTLVLDSARESPSQLVDRIVAHLG